jgi:hypothetical protein
MWIRVFIWPIRTKIIIAQPLLVHNLRTKFNLYPISGFGDETHRHDITITHPSYALCAKNTSKVQQEVKGWKWSDNKMLNAAKKKGGGGRKYSFCSAIFRQHSTPCAGCPLLLGHSLRWVDPSAATASRNLWPPTTPRSTGSQSACTVIRFDSIHCTHRTTVSWHRIQNLYAVESSVLKLVVGRVRTGSCLVTGLFNDAVSTAGFS